MHFLHLFYAFIAAMGHTCVNILDYEAIRTVLTMDIKTSGSKFIFTPDNEIFVLLKEGIIKQIALG